MFVRDGEGEGAGDEEAGGWVGGEGLVGVEGPR